jgi:hypothetical protein
MAKFLFTTYALTFAPVNRGTAATTLNYMALFGGTSTQVIEILEVMISGTATASTVAAMALNRASTIHTGALTALSAPASNGAMLPSTTALATGDTVGAFIDAATTEPTPSAAVTDASLNLGLNLFGGIVRWNAAPTQQWTMVGETAPGGESVLSNVNGGSSGTANAHIIYEPY